MAFPTTPLLATFNGADENPLTTNWTCPLKTGDANLRRSSNILISEFQGGIGDGYWDLSPFGPDVEVYATVATTLATDGDHFSLYARLAGVGTATPDGYYLNVVRVGGTIFIQTWRLDDGNATQLGSDIPTAVVAGDAIGLSCIGNTIRGYYRSVSGGGFTELLETTDTTYPSAGYIGAKVSQSGAPVPALDDFGGGTIVLTGPYGTPLLDNFNRADEAPLAGNWTTTLQAGGAEVKIISKHIETYNSPPAGTGAWWSARPFAADQAAYARILGAFTGTDSLSVYVRLADMGSASVTGYRAVAAVGEVKLYRQDGASTLLVQTGATWAAGDLVGISAVNNTLEAWQGRDGVWTSLVTYVDTVYNRAGPIGFGFSTATQTGVQIDDFGGGNLPRYVSEVMADSPVAYWRMNDASGNPADTSGNSHPVDTISGTPVYGQASPIISDSAAKSILCGAVSFQAPYHADFDIGNVGSVECWIKRTDSSTSEMVLCTRDQGFYLGLVNNRLLIAKTNVAEIARSTTSITDTTVWHHLVVTKNGATSRQYIDGVDVTGTVTDATWANGTTPGTRMAGDFGATEYAGYLAEVAVYPTALSQARIQAHYNAALASFPALSGRNAIGF